MLKIKYIKFNNISLAETYIQKKKKWIETCEKIIKKKKITCFEQRIKIDE